MPVETKKVLWTVFSVGAFLVIVLGVLLVAFYPKPGAENAPLALGLPEARGSAADRYTRPVESAPLPEALPAQTPAPVVVVPYGEKPEPGSLVPLPAAGAEGPAPTASIATPAPSATEAAADDPAIKRSYVPASGTAPKPSVVVTPESKPAAGATTSTKPASSPGAATTAAPAPKPSAAPVKSASVDEYWIQAGSFSSRTRAEDLQALLREKGLSSTIEARDAASGVVYRVRIGPWSNKEVADGWLGTVRKVDGCADAYVSLVTRKT